MSGSDAVLGLVVEALTAVSSGAVGFVLGRTTRPEPAAPLAEVCQCKHGSAFHDGDGCRVRVLETDPLTQIGSRKKCPCVHYVGPGTSYVPELDGPDGPLNGGWK
jgi:hypothetical protein